MAAMDFYVSTQGNDDWSGRLPEPNADKTDGPLATLLGARNRLRALTAPPLYYNSAWTPQGIQGPISVHIRGGRYALPEPLIFDPEDYCPATYEAYTGEKPILDGGNPIAGWRVEQVNGITAWVVDLPEVAAGRWYFRSLFVNGRRRLRPRLPKSGFYSIENVPHTTPSAHLKDGSDAFVCGPGQIRAWQNLADVEVVVLHLWVDEHMPIVSFDEATRLVRCSRRSAYRLGKDRFYVENVFEALTEPGEWYLDRATGRLAYIPMPGEDPDTAEVVAPRLTQLLRLAGRPDEGRYVQCLRFRGLTFRHTDAVLPRRGYDRDSMELDSPPGRDFDEVGADYASSPQSAHHIPGVIALEGARGCAIEDCVIEHVGWYAVELADGSTANRVVGNEMTDLGCGGVKLNGSNARGALARRTGNNLVTDNHIHHAGRVFHQGVGVLCRNAFGNVIAHNHIHDLHYSGISVGWMWGFADHVARNNCIEKNHIHTLGFGWVIDMAAVYLLGSQPGTVVRGNFIHDLESAEAIYMDEGSSHIVIENNLCHDTNEHVFHQHYGHENILRNNIFAFGKAGVVSLARADATPAFTCERNIFVGDGRPLYVDGYGYTLETPNPLVDLNLLWDVSGRPIIGRTADSKDLDLAQWRTVGNDLHSVVADPLFRDLAKRDFTLAPDSPALRLGFKPIDVYDVGPRPPEKRP